jgi:hypothetical protein
MASQNVRIQACGFSIWKDKLGELEAKGQERMKIRHLLILTLCLLLVGSTQAQTSRAETPERNIYEIALGAALDEMERKWGNFSAETKESIRMDYKNVLVVADSKLTRELPPTIGARRIRYLTYNELAEIQKKAKKRIPVIEIYPARLRAEKLSIGFNIYYFSQLKKNRYELSLSDGARVTFQFSTEKKRFEVESVELWGI